MSELGTAAARIAQEDEAGSAAIPWIRMAAARVIREDDP
jgi:hypothetical protein